MVVADNDPEVRSRKGLKQIVFDYDNPFIPGIVHQGGAQFSQQVADGVGDLDLALPVMQRVPRNRATRPRAFRGGARRDGDEDHRQRRGPAGIAAAGELLDVLLGEVIESRSICAPEASVDPAYGRRATKTNSLPGLSGASRTPSTS